MARNGNFSLRLAGALVVGLTAAAFAVPAASADGLLGGLGGLIGGSCPGNGSQVFAQWGDTASYYLMPNGGFESGSTNWSLSGGAWVLGGNEPFFASGSHSLSLPSGSTATSAAFCIGPNNVALRMFASDAGGTDSGLHVRIIWYGLLNKVVGISDYDTFNPGGPWQPTPIVNSRGGFNFVLPLLGSTSARIQLTPYGSGSKWRVDDVYVDPWLSA